MKPEKRIHTITAVHTDIGNLRKANEDSHYVSPDKNLIIVCDGMGGQIAGGLASKLAVETIKDIFMNLDEGQLGKLFLDLDSNLSLTSRKLVAAVRLANRRIYKMATRFAKLRGMGTTVIALSFDDNFATMAHVGDSRIFRVSDGAILQLTEDHSWLNELIEDKEIEENEIDRFAKKNVITRALGTHSAVKVDVHCEKYKKDDIYILSTDGLHNSIKQEEIRSVVLRSKLPLAAMAEKLTEKAKRRDGSDNITVAIAKVNEDSSDTEMTGVSTTVIEEDYRVLAGEDKFLMRRYTDSKVQLDPNYRSAARSRRNLMIAGTLALVIVAGLLFSKRATLFGGKLRQAGRAPVADVGRRSAKVAAPQSRSADAQKSAAPKTNGEAQSTVTVVEKAQLEKDAVMAFILFNNRAEFEKMASEAKGVILDNVQPFSDSQENAFEGKLTLFIVDSENNVLYQSAAIQLPEVNGAASEEGAMKNKK